MEFIKYPKTKRFSSDIIITEKIDGTNAQLVYDKENEVLLAGSRNRFITVDKDNYGFARWVDDNREILTKYFNSFSNIPVYGEWWGSGIQRGYGLTGGEKYFSIFNVGLFGPVMPSELHAIGVRYVPVLYEGSNRRDVILDVFGNLDNAGSQVFLKSGCLEQFKFYFKPVSNELEPEGICIFFKQMGVIYKMTYEYENGKWGDK